MAEPEKPAAGAPQIDRQLCRVGGLNQNYASASGTPCHVQIEDYGPTVDRGSDEPVRRLNVIVYANYGTPGARIIYGKDYDYPDVRTSEYNQVIKDQMNQLVGQAQAVVEQMEQRELALIRSSLAARRHLPPDELRKQFKECAELYPALFRRAINELKTQAADAAAAAAEAPAPPPVEEATAEPGVPASETVYPMEPELRRRVIEIEAIIVKLGQDFMRLKAAGLADDILMQRCLKLVDQARASISRGGTTGDLQTRMLDMTLENLAKTWHQVRSQLRKHAPRP
jgi:hypothetical protein